MRSSACSSEGGTSLIFDLNKCMVKMVVYNIFLAYIFLSLIRFQIQIGNYILKILDTYEVSTEA